MSDFNVSSLIDYIKARNDANDEVIVIAVPVPRIVLYGAAERDVIDGVRQMTAEMIPHAVRRKRLYGENSSGIVSMSENGATNA